MTKLLSELIDVLAPNTNGDRLVEVVPLLIVVDADFHMAVEGLRFLNPSYDFKSKTTWLFVLSFISVISNSSIPPPKQCKKSPRTEQPFY